MPSADAIVIQIATTLVFSLWKNVIDQTLSQTIQIASRAILRCLSSAQTSPVPQPSFLSESLMELLVSYALKSCGLLVAF